MTKDDDDDEKILKKYETRSAMTNTNEIENDDHEMKTCTCEEEVVKIKEENKEIKQQIQSLREELVLLREENKKQKEEFNKILEEKENKLKESEEANKRNEEEIESLRNENKNIFEKNIENLELKDDVINEMQQENETQQDIIQQLRNENKQINAEKNGAELLLQEKSEETKKLSGDKNALEKQIKKKEKDDKKEIDKLKEDVQLFKQKVEENEGISNQTNRTINNLNQYLEDLRDANKRLLTRGNEIKESHRRQEEISINDSIHMLASRNGNQEYNNQQDERQHEEMKVKIYVGNIDEAANEEDIRKVLELDRNDKVEIKVKTRKQTKQGCREEEYCEYKHFCKFVHLQELYETMKYAAIEVGESRKDYVLRKDGYEFMEKDIIVEEYPKISETRNTNTKVCSFYLKRKCSKGTQCTYRHPKECTYYKQTGQCKYEKNCKFAHMKNQHQNQNLEQMEEMMRYMTQFLPRTPMFVPQNIPRRYQIIVT